MKITLEDIEAKFSAKVVAKKEVAADEGPAVAKKKTFFPGDKQQNLFIVVSRLPKADVFMRALESLNNKSVSQDNLESLIKNWPKEEFDELI